MPFAGGPVTVSIGAADPLATIGSTAFGSATSLTVPAPAAPSGTFTLASTFTKAQSQSLAVTAGSLTGSAGSFAVVPGAPVALHITSLADVSQEPALPVPASGQTFAVGVDAVDAYGNLATTPSVPVTLSALPPAAGTLTAPPVATSGGRAVVTATYSVAQQALQLQVGSPGLTPDEATTDVVTAGASDAGTPGTPADLTAGDAHASLGNGSVGDVFLTTAPCPEFDCPGSTEISLDGVFTDPVLGELYSNEDPAEVDWTCSATECPYYAGPGPSYGYFPGYDFEDFPMQVSLKVSGSYQPFDEAPSCRDLSDRTQRGLTGALVTPEAQAKGFCVDVYAVSRVGASGPGPFGAVTLPVLFVEDPKLRPS